MISNIPSNYNKKLNKHKHFLLFYSKMMSILHTSADNNPNAYPNLKLKISTSQKYQIYKPKIN
jgi:hypothetical protein